MFIVLTERKRRRQPLHIGHIPVIGFVDRRGRPTRFHKGWYQSPVILEADYLSYLTSLLPIPRRKPITAVKPPRAPAGARKPARRARVDWLTTGETLERLAIKYPDYAIGEKANKFQGFVRQIPYKGDRKYRLTVWDLPKMPKRNFSVDGFNLFVMVKNKEISPDFKKHDPFILCSSVVSWRGTMDEVLSKIYDRSKVISMADENLSVQRAVSWRTALDSLCVNFFDNIGEPLELVGIQFRRHFSRYERGKVKHLQQNRRTSRSLGTHYTKNPKLERKKHETKKM